MKEKCTVTPTDSIKAYKNMRARETTQAAAFAGRVFNKSRNTLLVFFFFATCWAGSTNGARLACEVSGAHFSVTILRGTLVPFACVYKGAAPSRRN